MNKSKDSNESKGLLGISRREKQSFWLPKHLNDAKY